MSQNNDILIRIDDLGVSFLREGRAIEAVKKVSLSIRRGKTTAIVGESGSGKSVTSLTLLDLHPKAQTRYTGGQMVVSSSISGGDNKEIAPGDTFWTSLRGRKIAMIFQEPMTALNPVMTCGAQVAECLTTHRLMAFSQARQETIRLFEEVLIPYPEQAFSKYPHEMSGGQRQRVMIAMALSCAPDVLIADEPTTALDVTVQRSVLALLRGLQEKYGMGLLFITHDLSLVAEMADEVIVMRKGEVVEQGSVQDVLERPQHQYTQRLLAARPTPEKKGFALLEENGEGGIRRPTESHSEALVLVNGLTKSYATRGVFGKGSKPAFLAIDHVSFSIHTGETLGLVGESGCGKTTLSRALLGLVPPTSGEIWFKGMDLVQATKGQRREVFKHIQIVFQDPYSALNSTMTVGQMISEPIAFYGLRDSASKRRERVIQLLNQVGLGEEHYNRYPHEFSGGQRQRVVIARALAVEPSLLICDESVSALDVSVQAQVLNLLNELKANLDLTYLFISHDLNVVYYMSDRIMVMRKGKVEEIGTADEVFYRPKSHYTRQLLESIPGRSKVV